MPQNPPTPDTVPFLNNTELETPVLDIKPGETMDDTAARWTQLIGKAFRVSREENNKQLSLIREEMNKWRKSVDTYHTNVQGHFVSSLDSVYKEQPWEELHKDYYSVSKRCFAESVLARHNYKGKKMQVRFIS